jgi:hypothetical protein
MRKTVVGAVALTMRRAGLALHFPSKPASLRTDNRVATLEAAKAEFEASWEAWKAWAKLEEVA